jgi:N-methylhydantoinase A
MGMIVAPPVADASRTVVHLGEALDDDRLAAEFGSLSELTLHQVPYERTASTQVYVDARFRGQSHELKVRIARPTRTEIARAFVDEYQRMYGNLPTNRQVEIVTLRVRRIGQAPQVSLPDLTPTAASERVATIVIGDGQRVQAPALTRSALVGAGRRAGPLLVIDPDATTCLPPGWSVCLLPNGTLILEPIT